VLKPLARALADGDRLYAVVRGSAVNQDGKTNGLSAPSLQAQMEVLRRAYRAAGVVPSEVTYVETHGTGTPLGDPIEAKALGAVIGEGRPLDRPCAIGSVKTNIGHLEAAAGIIGVVKVALALHGRRLMPSIHFEHPNPLIDFNELRLRVQSQPEVWPQGRARIAGVSAFGFGGTNAHVVLEAAPPPPAAPRWSDHEAFILPLSARSQDALKQLVLAWSEHLGDAAAAGDLCRVAACRRSHFEHRIAAYATDPTALTEQLRAFAAGAPRGGIVAGTCKNGLRPPIAFVFSGHGGHWPGMGRGLSAREPVFRKRLVEIDRLVCARTGTGVLDDITAEKDTNRIGGDYLTRTQLATFSVQMALAALWQSYGIEPDAVIGHSVGEIAAACVSGALSVEDGVWVVYERTRLMEEAMKRLASPGAMAVVRLSADEARAALAGIEPRVVVAAHNAPRSTVLSGDAAVLDRLLANLKAQRVGVRKIDAPGAGHSPEVEPLCEKLVAALAGLTPRAAPLPFYSTVRGVRFTGAELDARYWGDNLRQPVLLTEAVERALGDGNRIFLELGPHALLSSFVAQTVRERRASATVLASMRQGDEHGALAEALAFLYVEGAAIDFGAVYRGVIPYRSAPLYPFQRERHWLCVAPAPHLERAKGAAIGERISSALHPGTHLWQWIASLESAPYLADHRLDGVAIFAAASYLDAALVAAAVYCTAPRVKLNDVIFHRVLTLSETRETKLQLVITQEETVSAFRIFRVGDTVGDAPVLHASGRIACGATEVPPAFVPVSTDRAALSAADHYEKLRRHGGDYGPAFQSVRQIVIDGHTAVGRVELPDITGDHDGEHAIHPALLDGCFQVLGVLAARDDDAPAMPVGVRAAMLLQDARCRRSAWVRAQVVDGTTCGDCEGDVFIYDDEGEPLAMLRGLRFRRLTSVDAMAAAFYRVAWSEQPAVERGRPQLRRTWLLLASPNGGLADALRDDIRRHGERCVQLVHGDAFQALGDDHYSVGASSTEDFDRALGEALTDASPLVIAHLWSVEGAPPSNADELRRAQACGCGTVIALVSALATRRGTVERTILVTCSTQAVSPGDLVDPTHATVWGLGRVLRMEHPDLHVAMIDVDNDGAANAHAIMQEANATDADEIALRVGARFTATLARHRPSTDGAPFSARLCSDGCYLVVGGLRGLGLLVAEHLAKNGARCLALMGRREPSDETETAIARIRAMGARVVVLHADVRDADQLESALAQIDLPLRGVVHAAAHFDDALIYQLDGERLLGVLAPKMEGAWLLDRLTSKEPLDFFVLFSSAASLLGSPGQGSYAAANAYLDAFAHHRRARGRAAVAIDWGPWAEVGGAAHSDRGGRLALLGVRSLSSEQGLFALEQALSSNDAQLGVVRIDWARLRREYPSLAALPFFAALLPAEVATDASLSAEALRRTSRESAVAALEAYLVAEIAESLRVPSEQVDRHARLSSLGLDSLAALQLKNRVEAKMGVRVPITQFLHGPTLRELTENLLSEIRNGQVTDLAPVIETRALLERPANMDDLSEEQLDMLISSLITGEPT
jgi:acyl transferase domain-containing protein